MLDRCVSMSVRQAGRSWALSAMPTMVRCKPNSTVLVNVYCGRSLGLVQVGGELSLLHVLLGNGPVRHMIWHMDEQAETSTFLDQFRDSSTYSLSDHVQPGWTRGVYKKLSCRWQTARHICVAHNSTVLQWRGWPPKNTSVPICVTMPNVVVLSWKVKAEIQENQQNWECSFGTGGVADSKIHAPPHMCYHVKYCSSARKVVRMNRREPPKLGQSTDDPLKPNSLLMCVTSSNLVVVRQTVYA